MRSQSLNIVGGMIAFAVTGAGVVYLALLTLCGMRVIAAVSVVPPAATGVTLAALVFSAHFVDSLLVYMSESYALYQENILRAEKAKSGIGMIGAEPETEESREVTAPVYQRDLIVTHNGKSYTVPVDVPLTEKEVLWGDVLIRALMHAWGIGAVDSGSLSGPGKPINQKQQWTDVTDAWRDMGIVKKDNTGTEMLVTFEQAVEMVYPKLRSVALPPRKPPKLPPLPKGMIQKWPRVSEKA